MDEERTLGVPDWLWGLLMLATVFNLGRAWEHPEPDGWGTLLQIAAALTATLIMGVALWIGFNVRLHLENHR